MLGGGGRLFRIAMACPRGTVPPIGPVAGAKRQAAGHGSEKQRRRVKQAKRFGERQLARERHGRADPVPYPCPAVSVNAFNPTE
jgi:hypothetical protein